MHRALTVRRLRYPKRAESDFRFYMFPFCCHCHSNCHCHCQCNCCSHSKVWEKSSPIIYWPCTSWYVGTSLQASSLSATLPGGYSPSQRCSQCSTLCLGPCRAVRLRHATLLQHTNNYVFLGYGNTRKYI